MNHEYELIGSILRNEDLETAAIGGLTPEDLSEEPAKMLRYIQAFWRQHAKYPSQETVAEDCRVDLKSVSGEEPVSYYVDKIRFHRRATTLSNAMREANDALILDPASNQAYDLLTNAMDQCRRLQEAREGIINAFTSSFIDEHLAQYDHRAELAARGEIDGFRTPWKQLDEATWGFHPGELWTFVARMGVGKCVAKGTLIPVPDTGEWLPVEDVVAEHRPVVTLDRDAGRLGGTEPLAWVCTGRKECLELRTRLGHSLTVTPEHPMLTSRGWVRADKLSVSDSVVAVAHLPEPRDPEPLPIAEVVLLAALLSEGSYSGHHVGFSSGDSVFIVAVTEAAKELSLRVRHVGNYDYSITGGARKLLRKHGLHKERAKEKRIPASIYRLPNDLLAEFLRVFWAGDGGKPANGSCEVCLASEGLIDDLQRLLLRFGVVAAKSYKPSKSGKKTFDAWRLRVESWTRSRFSDLMGGGVLEDHPKLRSISQLPPPSNPNTDNVPVTGSMVRAIKCAAKLYKVFGRIKGVRRGLFADLGVKLGRAPRQTGIRDVVSKNGRNSVGRATLRALLSVADPFLSDLRWMASDEIVFDRIVSIQPVGVRQVYDLSVEGTHNFVAEGLVAHNTWLLMLILKNLLEQEVPMIVVSMEMSAKQLAARLFALLCNVPSNDIRKGRMGNFVRQEYEATLREFCGKAPFWIVDSSKVRGVKDIEAAIIQTKAKGALVDGAYLLDKDKNMALWERVSYTQGSLKQTSHRCECFICGTSQLNRSVKKKHKNAGTDALAFADAVGYDSDQVHGLFQDKKMERDMEMLHRQLKNREDRPISFVTEWDLDNNKFGFLEYFEDEDSDEEQCSGKRDKADPNEEQGKDLDY